MAGQPGPSFLEVPFDIMFGKADEEKVWFPDNYRHKGRTQADPDEVPATRATDIQRGDMFELGKHRLLCGDCLNISDLDQLLRGQVAKLLITSPPYNQRIDTFRPSGMHKEGKWVTKVQRLAYSDSLPEIEYQKEQRAGLDLWFERVADAASVFYNH